MDVVACWRKVLTGCLTELVKTRDVLGAIEELFNCPRVLLMATELLGLSEVVTCCVYELLIAVIGDVLTCRLKVLLGILVEVVTCPPSVLLMAAELLVADEVLTFCKAVLLGSIDVLVDVTVLLQVGLPKPRCICPAIVVLVSAWMQI